MKTALGGVGPSRHTREGTNTRLQQPGFVGFVGNDLRVGDTLVEHVGAPLLQRLPHRLACRWWE